MGSLPEENLKITFFTDAPFIVKFRFEKYRYLLTFLLCIQIFEAPLSHSHSTGPQNISAGRLVPLSVACLVWWHSFRPQIYDESKTDQILNAKYFVWKNYTLGKWGSRKAFNQNSLMQIFNGDRPIVQWFGKMDGQKISRASEVPEAHSSEQTWTAKAFGIKSFQAWTYSAKTITDKTGQRTDKVRCQEICYVH